MRIYDRNLTGAGTGETSRAQDTHKAESRAEQRTSGKTSGDRVEFSGSLGALARAVNTDQTARQSKIQALGDQVRSGSYRPDSKAISHGLVSETLARTR